jgi:hypothetical protein
MLQTITVVGAHSTTDAYETLNRHILAAIRKGKKSEPSYSRIHDPYRVVIVSYEAALPLHALQGLDEMKRKYEEILIPSTHIDKRLQFSLPDLMPAESDVEKAFLTLTMGIIPELDCIHDEDMSEHERKYSVTDPEVTEQGGAIVLGTKFYGVVEYLCANGLLLEAIRKLVERKRREFEKGEPEGFRAAVLAHLEKLKYRFLVHGFSRPISGRYLYREMRYLLGEIKDRRNVEDYLKEPISRR